MKFDQYTLNARVYPAALCIIPIVLLLQTIDDPTIAKLLSDVIAIQVIGQISISVAAFFFLMQVARTLGKDVFEHILFQGELRFPTTDYLLPTNSELSSELKARIEKKVNKLLKMELPSMELCEADEPAARRQARDVVACIRGAAGTPRLLLQRNWEYGFYRNLAGGSIISMLVSALGTYSHAGSAVGGIFLGLAIAYLSVVIASRWLLRRSANHYTQQLFSAFLGDVR